MKKNGGWKSRWTISLQGKLSFPPKLTEPTVHSSLIVSYFPGTVYLLILVVLNGYLMRGWLSIIIHYVGEHHAWNVTSRTFEFYYTYKCTACRTHKNNFSRVKVFSDQCFFVVKECFFYIIRLFWLFVF